MARQDSNGRQSENVEEEEEEEELQKQEIPSKPGQDYADSDDESDEEFDDNSPWANVKDFVEAMEYSKEDEDSDVETFEDKFNFPKDPEKWTEWDHLELWADGPAFAKSPGWDPVWASSDDWRCAYEEIVDGNNPPVAPFYVPYRKFYPAIPDNHHDIANPKAVIEELDRIEEFMKWVSYIFDNGNSYEGTVWDDLAHGKGVYVAEGGLVRYEGEWCRNNMEGHGVVEVEIPGVEPVPGSKLEAKMRAQGKIISRDFMSPEDRRWLEMDVEDGYVFSRGRSEVPFNERKEWVRIFGKKPDKGRYRYAGQWKHGRMHGCGVYEVNENPIFGKFYFGELLEDARGCNEEISTLHAGIAEVAAAKARMFTNKPDGMVREQRGPYTDPQHPYMYEEEDAWMAPGFVHHFYEVPDDWKTYAKEVDQEREMWLNSFYKAPLRIPMPAELEHWWSQDDSIPEFVLVKKGSVPDPDDPTKLLDIKDPDDRSKLVDNEDLDDPSEFVDTEDPDDPSEPVDKEDPDDPSEPVDKEDSVIFHTRTGRLINFIEDEKHGIRLFWQPRVEEVDGELDEVELDPSKAEFLPLGYDEFHGLGSPEKEKNILELFITAVRDARKPIHDEVEKWSEEKKNNSEMKLKLIEHELEFVEAQITLEEAVEDMDMELKNKQKEEEKKAELSEQGLEDNSAYAPGMKDGTKSVEEEEVEDEDEDEDEDDGSAPTSFGSVVSNENSKNNDKGKPRKPPFSSSSLSVASCSLIPAVPSNLQHSFLSWRRIGKCPKPVTHSPQSSPQISVDPSETFSSVSFPRLPSQYRSLKVTSQEQHRYHTRSVKVSQLHSLSRLLSGPDFSTRRKRNLAGQVSLNNHQPQKAPENDMIGILSMHTPFHCLPSYMDNILE